MTGTDKNEATPSVAPPNETPTNTPTAEPTPSGSHYASAAYARTGPGSGAPTCLVSPSSSKAASDGCCAPSPPRSTLRTISSVSAKR